MSRVMTIDEEQVQFVLNDAEELSAQSLSDIIYSDGTRAILVNGSEQLLQSDTQTVVLQDEDFNQYYINDESGEILVADEQDAPITQSLEDAEVVQFIEEDGTIIGPPQIIYVNEEGYAINDSELSQYQIAEEDEDDSIMPSKTIKLEQVVDLEELLRQQGENETAIIDDSGEANGYQYAILKDGKLHIQSYNGDIFNIAATDILQEQDSDVQELTDKQNFDLSTITGKNLLTGQTVSLHNYMDKLHKKIKENKVKNFETNQKRRAIGAPAGLKALLNKKLTLGKTSSGKRLVGKVIYVEKKKKNESSLALEESILPIGDCLAAEDTRLNHADDLHLENVEESEDTLGFDESGLTLLPDADLSPELDEKPPPLVVNKKKVLIQEKLVSKECFGHICRTLSGLMNMDTVKKKLQHKNIIVKVVERKYEEATGGYAKKVSYGGGHMQEEFVVNDEGEMLENWSFVLDDKVKASILGSNEEDGRDGGSQYLETTNITMVITHDKNNYRAIRVILNPTNIIRCAECDREFSTNLQLKVHMLNSHTTRKEGRRARPCEVCGLQFTEHDELREHRDMHVEEGKLFRCSVVDCGKFFLTARRLQRHGTLHNPDVGPLRCSICKRRCSSESGLKKHLMLVHMNVKRLRCDTCGKSFVNSADLNFHKRTHGSYKYYECDICKRTFSRHSNLQRHIEIHRGSGELYQCKICGCSYHYMSSLTRHVVQNHIKRSDGETEPAMLENGIEEA